jgi:hypothetical protein
MRVVSPPPFSIAHSACARQDHVSAAIESLAAQYDAEEDGKLAVDGRSQRLQDMHARRLRAFGPALQATLEYLRAGEAPLIAR